MYVAFFLEVGLLLIVLPWSSLWDRNYFVSSWRGLQPVLTSNFVRGAVSGIGLVNLCAAFVDLGFILAIRRRNDVSLIGQGNDMSLIDRRER